MREKEMLNDLIIESREHLEKIEPDLLELEEKKGHVSSNLINRIFRAVHSIKGGFGFYGIKNVVNLAHAMENVMSQVRDKTLKVDGELVDALLKGIDKLHTLLDDVSNSDRISIEEELNVLNPFVSDSLQGKKKADLVEEVVDCDLKLKELHPDLAEEHMFEAVRNGKFMYQVTVDPKKDVTLKKLTFPVLFTNWERFGEILTSNPSRKNLESRKSKASLKKDLSVIVSSVLEPDLIGEALEIPQEQIFSIDLTNYKKAYIAEQQEHEKEQGETSSQDSKNAHHESRIEDALRVKVSLLNNLMNFAGELVLARNQLIQSMGTKLSANPEIDRAIKGCVESISMSVTKLLDTKHRDRDMFNQNVKTEMTALESRLRESLSVELFDIQGIKGIVQNLDMVTTMLQESIMQTRMQPLSVVFSKFPRVVRDLAKKLGKQVSLSQIGQDVELDKSIIELLSDPLTHLIRNCVDHGIEKPDYRKKSGKESNGEVLLRAFQEGGKVIIEITDDGAGIDPDMVKAKAIEKGILSKDEAETMSVKDIQMQIFAPGFSTAQVVSDLSGRGVGMDVVKTNIERLSGTIDVDSEKGKGTKVTLKLPLTLAIIPSLIVRSEGRRFAVPQVGLEEVVRIRAKDITNRIERIHNAEVLRLRGKLLPLVRLSTTLGIASTFVHPETGESQLDTRSRWSDRRGAREKELDTLSSSKEKREGKNDRRENAQNAVKVIVLKIENKLFGLVVDDVQDSEEIVVKPLPDYLKSSKCYAGATIMGDGKVAMILDPNGIADMASLKFEDLEKEIIAEKRRVEKEERKKLESILLFSIGGQELFGIDLSRVSRIEKRKVSEIEMVGNKEFLKYDDSSMRLFRIENYLPVQAPDSSMDNLFVIVPKNAKFPLGFATSRVEDTVETELNLDRYSVKAIGIKGSAVINKKMTVILDVPAFLQTLEAEFVK